MYIFKFAKKHTILVLILVFQQLFPGSSGTWTSWLHARQHPDLLSTAYWVERFDGVIHRSGIPVVCSLAV